jgi:formylglycine-generating enzyme
MRHAIHLLLIIAITLGEGTAEALTFLPATLHGIKTMKLVPGNAAISDFYMDETPVTYTDFIRYVRAGGLKNAYWLYESYNIAVQPVTGITWFHAADYCNWRSVCEGLSPVYFKTNKFDEWGYPVYAIDWRANGYRLPTTAQFEHAARGKENHTNYPWGEYFDSTQCNYDTDRGFKSTEWWRLAPVKSHYKNSYGLYNMCGNNWHWCEDSKPGTVAVKILKGGSWGSIDSTNLVIDYSSHTTAGNYNYDIGFRCVRPAIWVGDSISGFDTTAAYSFYKPFVSNVDTVITDFYSGAFVKRLAKFLGDNYPECIHFLQKVDEQEILTPLQMAKLIVDACRKNSINPLFLASIMISESGFGTVSFPRWYNNAMAYHWQNKLMASGYPVYESMPGKKNRKYAVLEDEFNAFCRGIRRELYYTAAKKNLDSFHIIYVGYRADEWMLTMSRVYRDVAGIRFEPLYPDGDAGKYIYTDWEEIKRVE